MSRSILFVCGWSGSAVAGRAACGLIRAAGAIALIAMAGPAFAEGTERPAEARPAVAPPGQCAEPRAAVDARTGDAFSVVGPVATLFDPVDVAAAPPLGGDATLRPAPPTARPLVRPGACDQPGSGCSAPTASGIVVEPPAGGGDGPPPGVN